MGLLTMLKTILGFLALSLGAVGLLLPVWPTTPFVLLAIGCFSATPQVQARILKIPFFREYYDSYTAGQGLGRKTVIGSMLFLWGMLALSILLAGKLWLTGMLLAIGSAVTVHILWMARKRSERTPSWRKNHEA